MSHRFFRAWQAVQAIFPGRRPCLFAFIIPDGPWRCLSAVGSMGSEKFRNIKMHGGPRHLNYI